MSVFYELLDAASGNVLDGFDTEQEALDALRPSFREHGSEALTELALLRFDGDHPTLVAMGSQLVAIVEAAVEHRDRPLA